MARVYHISKRQPFLFGGLSVNTILIIVNVLFFLIMLLFPAEFVYENIAVSLSSVQQLKLWTFVTSMFMHGGFFHLFANMVSLMFIGGFIEKLIGRKRYFWFYMISGLMGGLLYVLVEYLSPSGLPAVGASGAIFGIAGLMAILTPNLPLYVMFIPIPIKAKYAIPGLLVVLWLISVTGGVLIGNTAHLGGLIAAIVYGFYLRYKFPHKTGMLSKHFS